MALQKLLRPVQLRQILRRCFVWATRPHFQQVQRLRALLTRRWLTIHGCDVQLR
jgi:hypothetical protein